MTRKAKKLYLSDTQFLEAVDAYLTTALWSSTDEDGAPYDKHFGTGDFSADAEGLAADAITAFFARAESRLYEDGLLMFPVGRIAHDLWLTRNGHGAGFWSREEVYGDAAEPLAEIAASMGDSDVYISDDGNLELTR